jgi:hypothetical protein
MSVMLDAAVAMAEAGWSIFPCHWPIFNGGPAACSCKQGSACGNIGKHPRTEHGFLDATRDAERVARYWRQCPEANIGVATGEKNNISVLDVDPRHGGMDSLLILVHQYGELPETLRSRTGSGGEHVIFEHVPGVRNSASKLGSSLDIRGDGGFIIAPPSLHLSGTRYTWLNDTSPAPAPDWLAAALIGVARPELVGERRETTALTNYGQAALQLATKAILAASNAQEHTLNMEAYCIGQLAGAGGVPVELALEVLAIAANALKSYDPRRPWRPGQAEAKARNAFKQGLAKPRLSEAQLEAERRREQHEWADRLAAGETFHAG